jgi:hypothetical protein
VIVHKNLLKKLLTSVFVFTLVTTSAVQAAPKAISVKPLKIWSEGSKAEAMVATSAVIYEFENVVGLSSDIKVRAIDLAGAEIWSKTIDSGSDEVATALAVDPQGTIWIAGNSAVSSPSESATVSTGALNPDGIVIENFTPLRADMRNISVWQITSTGEVISQSSTPNVALIDAISVSASGLSILGTRDTGSFLLTLAQGKFSKELKLGTSKTKLNAVVRGSDGSTYLFGSSSETLGGKKLVGRLDGVLIKVSKTGALSSVVRSSATKALRDWQGATSSLFVTGSVTTGNITESALTKFNSSFVPTWTTRFASTGKTLGANGLNGSVYAVVEPTSAIKAISGLKLVKGQSVVLQFDSKGVLISAYTAADLISPVASVYSKGAGLLILTAAGKILQAPNL